MRGGARANPTRVKRMTLALALALTPTLTRTLRTLTHDSCTARNVISDIDYNNDPVTTAAFAAECRLPIPRGQEPMLHGP